MDINLLGIPGVEGILCVSFLILPKKGCSILGNLLQIKTRYAHTPVYSVVTYHINNVFICECFSLSNSCLSMS